jgi:hypothetical protein
MGQAVQTDPEGPLIQAMSEVQHDATWSMLELFGGCEATGRKSCRIVLSRPGLCAQPNSEFQPMRFDIYHHIISIHIYSTIWL